MNHTEKLCKARELIREILREHQDYDRARFRAGDIELARESGAEAGRLQAALTLLTEAYAVRTMKDIPT